MPRRRVDYARMILKWLKMKGVTSESRISEELLVNAIRFNATDIKVADYLKLMTDMGLIKQDESSPGFYTINFENVYAGMLS